MKEIQNANAVVPIDTPPVIGTIHSPVCNTPYAN